MRCSDDPYCLYGRDLKIVLRGTEATKAARDHWATRLAALEDLKVAAANSLEAQR